MELRQLRYFVAVASELSFTRAAAGIPVAVSALSTQIRRLESELGLTLLERTTHSVGLTPAGEQFLAVAVDVVGRLDRGVDEVRRTAPTISLTVAIVEEGLAELTGPVVDEFRVRHPRVELRTQPCPASQLFVLEAELDAILWVHPGPPFPDWTFDPVLESDPVLVMAEDHPLSSRPSVGVDEAVQQTFVRVPDPARPWFVRHYLDDHRATPAVLTSGEARDVPTAQSIMSLERAVMVQPSAKLRYFNRPGITSVPLTGVAPFPLGVARRIGDDRPAVSALVDLAAELSQSVPLGPGIRPATRA